MKKATKTLLLMLCAVVLVVSSILGTVAYLTSTDTVTNTFTVGNVTIELKERAMKTETGELDTSVTTLEDAGIDDIKVIPGRTIYKQPVVIVNKDSEECWLFVKIENGVTDKKILDAMVEIKAHEDTAEAKWEAVGSDGWYQYTGKAAPALDGTTKKDAEFQVFDYFKFDNLTNDEVKALEDASIKVTAYAIQADGVLQDTALNEAKKLANPPAQNP